MPGLAFVLLEPIGFRHSDYFFSAQSTYLV